MAEDVSPCPADTIPVQIIRGENYSSVFTIYSVSADMTRSSLPEFSKLVNDVAEHVGARLAREELYLSGNESRKGSLLQFVPLPVEMSKGRSPASLPPLEAPPSGGCRVSSPWIDLVIERGPVPKVRGVVRFSVRQLLTDQAILAGVRGVPPGSPPPLKEGEFNKYTFMYEGSEVPPRTISKPIEELVPPDLLWLFRHVQQSSKSPSYGNFNDAANYAMNTVMQTGAEGYMKIVMAMVDRCLASEGGDLHYNSILDLDDLALFEEYKIIEPFDLYKYGRRTL